MRLNDVQTHFKDNILDSAPLEQDSSFSAQFTQNRISLDDRFSVYRNNVLKSLTDVIVSTYPVIEKLVGDDFLRQTARRFVKQNLPEQAQLHVYGGRFADFLETFEPAEKLPYLPDIARMEWAWHEAYYAPDDEPLDTALLKEDVDTFTLRTSVRLLESRYPLDEIRAFSLQDSPEGKLDIDKGGVQLLIFRPALDVKITRLEVGEYKFLNLLQEGSTVEQAMAGAVNSDPAFDLTGILQKHFAGETFSQFKERK